MNTYFLKRSALILFIANISLIYTPIYAELSSPGFAPIEPIVKDPDTSLPEFILTDESADQVIQMLERLTGKIILRRQDLPATKINFNSKGPIKKSEAILALESLLTLNGVMLTDMGDRFLKAVPASNPNSQVPKMLSGTTLDMPPSQQIYAKLFKLNYLVADQGTLTLINPLLSLNNSIITFPKSNAILITDSLVNLQRIESIIIENDQPQFMREHVEFIKLKFVQAKDMEGQLRSLIDGSLKSYLQGNTNITIDERTNQLILVTHPGNLALIKSVIDNIDIDAAPLTASEVFPLKQAKADEVVKIIDEIISGQRKGREDDAKTAANEPSPSDSQETISENQSPNTISSKANSNASLQFSEFVGLSADDRTNSIVAYGTQQDLKTLKTLIEKIDIPLPQVRIEAIITEVGLNEKQGTGLKNFQALFDDVNPVSASGTELYLSQSGFNTSTDSSGNLLPSIVLGKFSIQGILELAESDSDVKVLSTPSIVVSHNEEGVINVSESRPILTGTTSSVNSSGISTSLRDTVEYRDIGIQLEVTPLIGADGSVQMEIQQSADQISKSTEVNNNPQPIIGRREANSTITVNDGQIAVLAGLQQNESTNEQTIFPIIGRIPILKNIFSGNSKEYNRTELIIFIKPTILRNTSDTSKLTSDILENYEEGTTIEGYIEAGTIRDIYMDGSRLSPTQQSND